MADHKPTIDERLERLTDRHEVLAQSVEVLSFGQVKTENLVAEMARNVNSLASISDARENRIADPEDRS